MPHCIRFTDHLHHICILFHYINILRVRGWHITWAAFAWYQSRRSCFLSRSAVLGRVFTRNRPSAALRPCSDSLTTGRWSERRWICGAHNAPILLWSEAQGSQDLILINLPDASILTEDYSIIRQSTPDRFKHIRHAKHSQHVIIKH